MNEYHLSEDENKIISELTTDIYHEYKSVEEEGFLTQVGFLANELPKNLRKFLYDFKQHEDVSPMCLVSGYNINNQQIGKTPKHWKDKKLNNTTINEEIYFMLCGSLIGYPIAWSTQQDGLIVHDIFPMIEHEKDQLGFSSKENLDWHTEDAFHELRGDYIALMGMRNPTHTPTMIASNADLNLSLDKFKPLFLPTYKIKPDNSHLQEAPTIESDIYLEKAKKAMCKLNLTPDKIPVLFGDPNKPYWRLDPYFMEIPEDESAREALNFLIQVINENLIEIVIKPGAIFICDNFRVVHGRPPFTAKYDGLDRWLKRLNIVTDLRKSRAVRKNGTSRIFY